MSGLALSLGACATVTRGTTNQVTFNSEPAGASVRTSAGHACQTPCTISIDRKSEFIATFSKDGYGDMQIPVATRLASAGAAGFVGNVLIGGVVGMAADAYTGAALEHFPNPVVAEMRPIGRPVIPPARRRVKRPDVVAPPRSAPTS